MATTVASLVRHANENPAAIAIVNDGARLSYADLARGVGQFAQALRALGLGPGRSCAIECADYGLHLLLLLACEWIGAASASFVAADFDRPIPLPAQVDLVVAEHTARIAGAHRLHAIAPSWVRSVFALTGESGPPAPLSPDGLARIHRTSGTTGAPKYIAQTRRVFEARMDLWMEKNPVKPGGRALIVAPFSFSASVYLVSLALRGGATAVFERRVEIAEAISLHGITNLVQLPLQLRDLLQRLPPGFVKPADLTIQSIGGRLSPHLGRRVLAQLATRVIEQYATNELGPVSERVEGDGTSFGAAHAGVTIEIVDGAGRPQPFGVPGIIRVKSPYAVDGYLDDPEATARMFKDGWFHPGDLGILHGPGQLEFLGRDDEILNVGGLKVLPEDIEDMVRADAAVDDVGVCALPNADGVDEVWIAVVYDAPDDRDIRARLRPALADFPYGHVHLVKLPAIPRTDTGKIKRGELRTSVATQGGAAATVPLASEAPRGEAGRGGADNGR